MTHFPAPPSQPSDDRNAIVDDKVRAALAVEYDRERRAKRTRPARQVRAAAVAVIFVVAALGAVLIVGNYQETGTPSVTLPTVTASVPTSPSATTPTEPVRPPQPAEADALISALNTLGLSTADLPDTNSPVASLTGKSRRYCVEDTLIQILEYSTVAARKAESAGISPDGQVTTTEDDESTLTVTQWSFPPRFFAHDRLIVLALGPSDTTVTALTSLLGQTLTPEATGLESRGTCQ